MKTNTSKKRPQKTIDPDLRLLVWDEYFNADKKVSIVKLAARHGIGESTVHRWLQMPRPVLAQLAARPTIPNKKMPPVSKQARKKTKKKTSTPVVKTKVLTSKTTDYHTERLFMQACTNVLSVDDTLCVMLEYQRLR